MSKKVQIPQQAEVNIGLVGHVDHGKTTLVQSLSGVWTDRHSEEVRRGISIKLGYADTTFRKCPKCKGSQAFTVENVCPNHKTATKLLRRVSFVDAPGHEILLATMLSGATLMDGAILVIAANEECPQPQTAEHLDALLISNVKKIVIVQNKIELVTPSEAKKNYRQIVSFIKNRLDPSTPIIPISAIFKANLDVLIQALETTIPTPKRDLTKPGKMFIARSFDVNKPGTKISDLKGGVIGGSITQGKFKVNDRIEIKPGIKLKKGGITSYETLITKIRSIHTGDNTQPEEAMPGGLIGLGTDLDPYTSKADGIVGNIAGLPNTIPDPILELKISVNLMKRVVGVMDKIKISNIIPNEPLMLNVGTAVTVGVVTQISKGIATLKLKRPVCVEKDQRVAVSRQIGSRWRLIGYGEVK